MQLNHQEHNPLSLQKDIAIICDHISSPANVGSIFRLADAFGVKELIFYGEQPDLESNRLRRTARNTLNSVRFRESENLLKTIQFFHENNYLSLALEITSESIRIQEFDFLNNEKFVLIIGNERKGISQEVLKHVNHTAHIPMYGANSSMNVAQATGIALYEITRE